MVVSPLEEVGFHDQAQGRRRGGDSRSRGLRHVQAPRRQRNGDAVRRRRGCERTHHHRHPAAVAAPAGKTTARWRGRGIHLLTAPTRFFFYVLIYHTYIKYSLKIFE